MKKIFYLLLLTAITLQGQTTGVNKLKIAANPEKTTAPRVLVQETNGDVGYVPKSSFETAIPTGTISQYWRGDKTWQTLPSGGVWGSITGSITNQTDLQNALNAKQNLLTNPITGAGTINTIPKFSSTSGLSNSNIIDDGTTVTILTDVNIKGMTFGNVNGDNTNMAIGVNALGSITTQYFNTAIGYNTLRYSIGNLNTAIGSSALESNTSGGSNTAIGFNSLNRNTTGASNVAIGGLYNNLTGNNNLSLGYNSMNNNTSGGSNSAIGSNSLYNLTTGSNNISVGFGSGSDAVAYITTQSNQIVIGNNSATNAYIKIGWTVTSDARDKTNFAPVPYGLSFVNSLQPIKYQFRESRTSNVPVGDVKYGFRAQDVLALEGANPVIIDAKDPNNLKYTEGNMIPVLVNAIKELSQKVTALEAEVQILKNK